MIDTVGLVLKVGLSLAAVLGVLWLCARLAARGGAGRAGGAVEVLARQQVGRGAAVTVVRVADRALVLGVTEQGVSLLTDTDLEAVTAASPAAPSAAGGAARTALDGTTPAGPAPGRAPAGPLAGSVLSPATWRAAVDAVRERTVRRA
ncbi:flagellar biosynthetic protein FliO [Vallicoccus soli]|uniref:Flagellar protein n=1 Tax=Vallicoccus soli TaxID=2339232 RepID=A0A3A3ZCU7_9ACTN|nr:flagellar biosynthetic protein FliO [Vallicoccus soli]RJK92804.1 flagellar biosynthetic protein FliO [Vallicoccus soli]